MDHQEKTTHEVYVSTAGEVAYNTFSQKTGGENGGYLVYSAIPEDHQKAWEAVAQSVLNWNNSTCAPKEVAAA